MNGKLRGEVQAPVAAGEAEVRALAEAEERVQAHLAREDRPQGGLRAEAAPELRGRGLTREVARARGSPPPPGPALCPCAACGYGFSTRYEAQGGARRIHVRPFENRSTEPALGAFVTAALRDELARRGADARGGRGGVHRG